MDDEEAQRIYDTIVTFEFFSQLTLGQLHSLQNMINYIIDEKEEESNVDH